MRSCKTIERLRFHANIIEKTWVNEKYNMYWFNNSEITEKDYQYFKTNFDFKPIK